MSENEEKILQGLARFCVRNFDGAPKNLKRLTGGANMEIWSFDCADLPLILRRYPNGLTSESEVDALNLNDEAAIIHLAESQGVTAPKLIARLDSEDGLGIGFVMERKLGEALPHKLFRDEKYASALPKLIEQFGAEFAKIHRIDPAQAPDSLAYKNTAEKIAQLKQSLEGFGMEIPIFSYALRWLEDNIPDEISPCLLHGDFRMGNLLIDEAGITAVLDWELAHIGDPAEDLTWLCVPSWRFGRYDNPVGGVGQIDDLLRAYEAAGGCHFEESRIKFWLIYGTLRWGAVTLSMTDLWRKHFDRSVERVLIGSRVSEVEMDLLLMLEDEINTKINSDMDYEATDTRTRHAEPESSELVEAVVDWMRSALLPREAGVELFNTRVAVNALSVAQRLLTMGPHFEERASERLSVIGVSHNNLCKHLYDGTMDLTTQGVLYHLRLLAVERLAQHQPKYAALNVAKRKWNLQDI